MHERLVDIGENGVSVRFLGGNRAGEMRITRFLRNKNVSVMEMVSHSSALTASQVEGRHILAIQDTTHLRDDGKSCSIVAHPTIAVDGDNGTLLGLIHAEILEREGGKRASRAKLKIEDKQSHRWIEGSRRAGQLLQAGARKVTVISDSESDIYEVFTERPQGVDLLLRSRHNRKLADSQLLSEQVDGLKSAGKMVVSLPASPGRKARDLKLSLRYCKVEFKRPQNKKDEANLAEQVEVYVVDAKEISPPKGTSPAHWRLITTDPVTTLEEACSVIRLYRQRWMIEQLFRVLKTKGFDIEAVRINESEPFKKLALACLIAAISVLQLVRERDGEADRPISDVFDPKDMPFIQAVSKELEGNTEKQKNPFRPDSLAFAVWVCARLGGWTGYYGKPGPIVIAKGTRRLAELKLGWSIAKNV